MHTTTSKPKQLEKAIGKAIDKPIAIVTGASSGIGAETALALARSGYDLTLAARRVDRLEALAVNCRKLGAQTLVQPTDVSQLSQVQQLVDTTVGKFGRVDVMVNNAGFGQFGALADITEAQMREIFDVNYFGVFFGCKAVAPVMMAQESGHIFNVSSVLGKRGSPFHSAYSASKFAVGGLSESFRVEMTPYNVKVTCVCPALTETEFFGRVRDGQVRNKSDYLKKARKMPADRVARKMVSTIGKNKPELVFTFGGKFLGLVNALWPRLADRIMKVYHDDLVRAAERMKASK